jgi:C-terminal processing protease CtpA/Prc
MVPGLDPHSDFSTLAFKDLQISTQGSSGGLGIEVGVEDGIVRVCRRSRTPRRSAPASNPATSSSR